MSYGMMIANAFATGTPIKVKAMTGAQLAALLAEIKQNKEQN